MTEEASKTIYVVKITANHERNDINLMEKVTKKEHLGIFAILFPD